MKGPHARPAITRIVDADRFSRNFLAAIRPLSAPELRRLLAQCQNDNRGTEGEALIIELIEERLTLREITDR